MKAKIIFIAILSVGILLTSCEDEDLHIVPSNNVTSKTLSVSGFNKLNISDPFTVQVTFSETEESVIVESNNNVHQVISITQHGEILDIGLYNNSKFTETPVLNVYIVTSSIENVSAEGASSINFQNPLYNTMLEIELEGASLLTGELYVDELYAYLTGASELNISGETNGLDIDAEGASLMMGFEFACNQLQANLSGASALSLTISEKLDIIASGGSTLYYKGNAEVDNQKLSGGSRILKMD